MRALLSVYDKTGVLELAQGLHDLGWDLVSSGGTARSIREAGIAVADTAEVTGFPAILGHRVVTLHPKIHGGILADRANPHHVTEMADYGIEPFDLVVGNLYPLARIRLPSTTAAVAPRTSSTSADPPWCAPQPRTTPMSAW